jgi:hypothetical protein
VPLYDLKLHVQSIGWRVGAGWARYPADRAATFLSELLGFGIRRSQLDERPKVPKFSTD